MRDAVTGFVTMLLALVGGGLLIIAVAGAQNPWLGRIGFACMLMTVGLSLSWQRTRKGGR